MKKVGNQEKIQMHLMILWGIASASTYWWPRILFDWISFVNSKNGYDGQLEVLNILKFCKLMKHKVSLDTAGWKNWNILRKVGSRHGFFASLSLQHLMAARWARIQEIYRLTCRRHIAGYDSRGNSSAQSLGWESKIESRVCEFSPINVILIF